MRGVGHHCETSANECRLERIRVPELCLFAYCRGDITTAVAEYPDNVDPHKQISKAPAPFCFEIRALAEYR